MMTSQKGNYNDMGNRAVITTRENWKNNGVGVYLHWNGGRDSVQAFLKYCKMKGYRTPETDNYGWARLCQVCSNYFGGSTSVGIDILSHLDCDNGDNGVYIIENWEIVDRSYFSWAEQDEYDINEFLQAIDSSMPTSEQFGADYMQAPIILPKELKIGDKIAYLSWDGTVVKAKVIGIGADTVINGTNVKDIPYIVKFSLDAPETNINNYLFDDREYRKIR